VSGVIYSGELSGEKLKSLVEEFFGEGEAFYVQQETETYVVGEWKTPPRELFTGGCVFSEKGEIRWQRRGEKYSALIITDGALEGLPSEFRLVHKELKEEEQRFYLEPLSSPRISPNFEKYPRNAKRVIAKVLYKNSMPIAISLRGFEE